MLEIKNLTKSFEQLRAVDGVSLSVPQGGIIGLIGPNGSGKSTLFSLIAELNNQADSGQIIFNGQDITRATPDHIFKAGLIRSYQDPQLFFRMSTLDNAILPHQAQQGERLRTAPWHRRWHKQEADLAAQSTQTLQNLLLDQHVGKAASDLSRAGR